MRSRALDLSDAQTCVILFNVYQSIQSQQHHPPNKNNIIFNGVYMLAINIENSAKMTDGRIVQSSIKNRVMTNCLVINILIGKDNITHH